MCSTQLAAPERTPASSQMFREREAAQRIRARLIAPDGLITTMRAKMAVKASEGEAERLRGLHAEHEQQHADAMAQRAQRERERERLGVQAPPTTRHSHDEKNHSAALPSPDVPLYSLRI